MQMLCLEMFTNDNEEHSIIYYFYCNQKLKSTIINPLLWISCSLNITAKNTSYL